MIDQKRIHAQTIKKIITFIAALFLAFIVGAVILLCVGKNPVNAFYWLFNGAFGGAGQFSVTMNKMSVYLLCGMSCAFGYKCGLINIGAQGQMVMGALGSCVAGLFCEGLPTVFVLIISLCAGIACGALWAAISGLLKVYFGASEVITTVMLNYIAILLVDYMTNGPLKDPASEGAKTKLLLERFWLKAIIPGTKIHVGIIIAVVLLIIFGLFFKYSKVGFAVRVTGSNVLAARHNGIDVKRNQLLSMAVCGALAGIAGFIEVFGTQHQLISGFATDYGFEGIAVALLGQGHPVGILFSGFLFGAMKAGSNPMQMFGGVPYAMINVIQGLMIIFVIAGPAFTVLKRRGK